MQTVVRATGTENSRAVRSYRTSRAPRNAEVRDEQRRQEGVPADASMRGPARRADTAGRRPRSRRRRAYPAVAIRRNHSPSCRSNEVTTASHPRAERWGDPPWDAHRIAGGNSPTAIAASTIKPTRTPTNVIRQGRRPSRRRGSLVPAGSLTRALPHPRSVRRRRPPRDPGRSCVGRRTHRDDGPHEDDGSRQDRASNAPNGKPP